MTMGFAWEPGWSSLSEWFDEDEPDDDEGGNGAFKASASAERMTTLRSEVLLVLDGGRVVVGAGRR